MLHKLTPRDTSRDIPRDILGDSAISRDIPRDIALSRDKAVLL